MKHMTLEHIVLYLFLLLAAYLPVSCSSSDISDVGTECRPVTVMIGLGAPVATRALNDDASKNEVYNVNVMVFNHASGNLVTSKYTSSISGGVQLELMTNTEYDIYAIANYGSDISSSVKTLTALKSLTHTLASPGTLDNAIMCGSVTQKTVAESENVSISMSCLCSRQYFNITPSSGITITGYQLCHAPLSSYIVPGSTSNPDNTYGDSTAVENLTSTDAVTQTYYTYENLQGNKSACTTEQLRNSTNAPSDATYLLVNAKGSGWHSTYRIYLGGVNSGNTTDYTDFNIHRNWNYTYNINITGSGQSDARVTYTSDGTTTGEFLFSDGSWGTLAANPTKTPIAIVFSNEPSATDKAAGYTHGYAMALKDANTGTIWGPYGTDVIGLTNVTTTSALIADKDGRTESNVINSSTYPAAYAATTTYKSTVSAPSGTSGWYLPSIGQWFDICVNLGEMSSSAGNNNYYDGGSYLYWSGPSLNCATNINNKLQSVGENKYTKFAKGNIYWSSSEYSRDRAYYVYFGSSYPGLNNDYKGYSYKVRPVIAF
jgi:hypothetical protein